MTFVLDVGVVRVEIESIGSRESSCTNSRIVVVIMVESIYKRCLFKDESSGVDER